MAIASRVEISLSSVFGFGLAVHRTARPRLDQSGRARDRIIGVEQRRCLAAPTTTSRPEPLRTGYSPWYPQTAAGTSIFLARQAIERSLRAVVMPATAVPLRLPRH